MDPEVRIDLNSRLTSGRPIKIELGVGQKLYPDRICIDLRDVPGADILADLNFGLPFLPDNSVDAIYSKSVLEHIDNLELLMKEIHRVLKPGGKKYLYVPHFSSPYYYSDFTHQRFFGLYTFFYFSREEDQWYRKVPQFYTSTLFKIVKLRLEFGSAFPVLNFIKKTFGRILNRSKFLMEFYEENLCYIFPCHGIYAELSPVKDEKDEPLKK